VEVKDEVMNMLTKVGWKKDFVSNSVPILPISGWEGDNLLKKSDKMPWWKGCKVQWNEQQVHIETLYDALERLISNTGPFHKCSTENSNLWNTQNQGYWRCCNWSCRTRHCESWR